MTKIILIDKRTKRTGTTNGRNWAIYEYTDSEHRKLDSFDEFVIGEEVDAEITEEEWKRKDGSVGGKNLKLAKVKFKQNYNDPRFDALKRQLDELEARVEGLEMNANAEKVKEELPDDFPFKN